MITPLYSFVVLVLTPDAALLVRLGAVASSTLAQIQAMEIAERISLIGDGVNFKIKVKRIY